MDAPLKPSLAGRIGLALFLSVFVLAFGAGGLLIGVRPLWHLLQEAPRLQHYVPVPARVLEARMDEDSDGDPYLVARYQYQHLGRTLTGNRIAWSLNRTEQFQWHQRLDAARGAGQTVVVWIDPEHPGLALLDRELRWSRLAFLLPFALIFPAISVCALVMLIAVLRGERPTNKARAPSAASHTSTLHDNSKAKAWGITAVTLLWNLIAVPLALTVWADGERWRFVDIFISLFPAVGLLMAWGAVQMWRDALRHKGSALTLDTGALHTGEPAGITAHLPPSRWRTAERSTWQARLVQSSLPDDDSERSQETLSEQILPLSIHAAPDGGGQLRMRLHWPAHALPSGISKEGHRISWRLVLDEVEKGREQVFDLPVQAGRPGFAVTPDRSPQSLPAATAEAVPATVMQLSQEQGIQLASFARPWRVGGAIAIGLLGLGLGFVSRQHFNAEDSKDALIWLLCSIGSVLVLGLALHIGTRRWVVGITREAWWLDRSSNLLRHSTMLATSHQHGLEPRLTHTNQAHGQAAGYHRLEQWDEHTLRRQAVTPPLHRLGVALGVAGQLQSLQQRAGVMMDADTFSTRSPTARERLSTLTAWLVLSTVSLGVATHLDTAASLTVHDTARAWLPPVRQQFNALLGIGQADRALLAAIDQRDDQAVRTALREGANPSAIASHSGRSALMLAAGRGLLPIMDILLQHGADVNYADDTSVNERGDTALLMAAYFGQPEAFEKLLAAGARTNVVNRWGWTPVHMAAAGDCVPCLASLARLGLPLNSRATASRGESPLQMAAAKGRVNAMQWLLAHGADASQLDDHGQDVFAWARFFKQGDSERWLQAHLPSR